jgi:hypothetical protein
MWTLHEHMHPGPSLMASCGTAHAGTQTMQARSLPLLNMYTACCREHGAVAARALPHGVPVGAGVRAGGAYHTRRHVEGENDVHACHVWLAPPHLPAPRPP